MDGFTNVERLEAALPIFLALEKGGFEARYVGGCVRDFIMGRDFSDIDLTSAAQPEVAIGLLSEYLPDAVIIPTGLKHGTITVILDGEKFELTTLRRDVETDGRWAKVEYTDDWQADAARRDFTMNAISMDKNFRF